MFSRWRPAKVYACPCKVVAAALSPNANHVLQRLVATLRPHDCQPLIDELLQAGMDGMACDLRSRANPLSKAGAATVLEVARGWAASADNSHLKLFMLFPCRCESQLSVRPSAAQLPSGKGGHGTSPAGCAVVGAERLRYGCRVIQRPLKHFS